MSKLRPRKERPEAISGLYAAIPAVVLDCVAFQGAGYTAKALLFELMRQHDSRNNGHLHLARAWLHGRGWTSPDVVHRATVELINRNLVLKTRQGGLNFGASRFALTWLKISNFVGLDIDASKYHPGGWALMNKQPLAKNNPLVRETDVPSTGAVPNTYASRTSDLAARTPAVPEKGLLADPACTAGVHIASIAIAHPWFGGAAAVLGQGTERVVDLDSDLDSWVTEGGAHAENDLEIKCC